MKKIFICGIIIVIVIFSLYFSWYTKNVQLLRNIKQFNSEYEIFLDKEITGVDLTTIINKAIENNNQYDVEKKADGTYQNDGKNSIEIIIKPTKDGNSYPMEAFEKVGMREFTKNFGGAIFKSKNVEYHDNGRISKIEFEIIEK